MRPKTERGGVEAEGLFHDQEAERDRKRLTNPFKGPCDGQS